MTYFHTLAFAVCLLWLPLMQTAAQKKPREKQIRKPRARVVPVLRFEYGSKMKVSTAFENISSAPFKYQQVGRTRRMASLGLLLMREGRYVDRLSRGWHAGRPICTLPPGRSIHYSIDINNIYGKLKPGEYELRVTYDIKQNDGLVERFGLTPLSIDRTIMIIYVDEPLPKHLHNKTHQRIKQVAKNSHYFHGVDVGLGPTRGKEATLFFVVRQSELGEAKLKEKPEQIFRPWQVDPESKIEAMVYNPFPNADDGIIEVHVLVTEPNKRQHYLVVDLTETGNPKLPTVKKKQTLKPGQRYKLHQKPLGPVQLVPVDRK